MKNEILDIPFKDKFSDVLKKNEKILWRGSPQKGKIKKKQILIGGLIQGVMIGGAFYIDIYHMNRFPIIACLLILVGIISYFFNKYIKLKTEYIITQERILFNLPHLIDNTIHEIPFSEINNFVVTTNKDNLGTIFLAVKNPQLISFETHKDDEIEVRAQPTLELIENLEEVDKLIRQGIRNASIKGE